MPSSKLSKPESSAAPTMPATRYASLKRDVQRLTTHAEQQSDQAKVEAFWHLGERLAREKLDVQYGYQNALLRDLSNDTGLPVRNLRYALSFHQQYKRVPKLPLSWAHYRVLLDRPDTASRAHYQAIAVEQSLPVHKLARLIASDKRAHGGASALARPSNPGYLYRAKLDQIIDGDTLDLVIDLGFHVDRRGRFRLAAIDCPELPSTPGRAARDYVFQRLGTAQTIVVKTERHPDLHGRYVTHLFYAPTETTIEDCFTTGTYLNAELVDGGFAEIVTG